MKEELAALIHDMWSGWIRYVASKSTFNSDGSMTIPTWAVSRRERQMKGSYNDLSEEEKDSDRQEADKVLELFARRLLLANTVIERNPPQSMPERIAEARYAMTGGDKEPVPVDVIARWLDYIEDGLEPMFIAEVPHEKEADNEMVCPECHSSDLQLGDRSSCKTCGKPIEYVGPYWRHTTYSPRHIASPISMLKNEKENHDG